MPLPQKGRRALEGVRILDFTWVVAGPVAVRILADQGAEIIKIERRDTLDLGTRRGGFSGNLHRGKESTVINMADPRGIEIAQKLAAISDVVIDNFSARVMRNWGLDYESLKKIKPDIIAVSMVPALGIPDRTRIMSAMGRRSRRCPVIRSRCAIPVTSRLAGAIRTRT